MTGKRVLLTAKQLNVFNLRPDTSAHRSMQTDSPKFRKGGTHVDH
jgi:hypothetical protein